MKSFKYFSFLMTIMVAISLCIAIQSCSKEDDEKFNYPLETLYGTWEINEVKTSESGSYTTWRLKTTTATFNNDGSYSGRGYFGNGSGTYKAVDNTITTYVNEKVYIVYTVLSLTGSTAELKMSQPNSDKFLWIKCVKR